MAIAYTRQVVTRTELLADGRTGREIIAAVRAGELLRIRRDRYATPSISKAVVEAVRIGGRLTCLSLLQAIGVFVLACGGLHVHVEPGTSRTRRPRGRTTRVHWDGVVEESPAVHAASVADAVRQSIRCQSPRAAIATLDSVVHHGLLTLEELRRIFEHLPKRYSTLLSLVDASEESGPETFMRLILRGLGVRFETQVDIPGVGRVDFLVEGWLIIECDSKAYHEGWEKQQSDRRRDIAAAGAGYVTIRPLAADLLHRSGVVRRQLISVFRAFDGRLGAHSGSQLLSQ